MPKKILIIEDDKFLSEMYATKLKEAGFEVEAAYDGEEGLYAAEEFNPDLILLDILMPKMDGVQVMKKLREDSWGKNVPVILLTKLDLDDQKLREIVQYGAAYYLVKRDWSLEDVVKKVKEVLIKQ